MTADELRNLNGGMLVLWRIWHQAKLDNASTFDGRAKHRQIIARIDQEVNRRMAY